MSPRCVEIPMEQADVELQGRLKGFLDLVDESIQWARRYNKAGFAAPTIRNIRRDAERAYRASKRRLCVGLFGPSQSGKSFLIGELGRGADPELLISRDGPRSAPVSFLEHINPNHADEATGVVCRLTRFPQVSPDRPGTFAARVLAQGDILKCLATGFAFDCNFPNVGGLAKRLAEIFEKVPEGSGDDPFLEVLDDAWAYVQETFGVGHACFATLLNEGDIRSRLSRSGAPPIDVRHRLASTLWGMGETPIIDTLYRHLTAAHQRFGSAEYVEIDQSAIVSEGSGDERTITDSSLLADLMKGRYGTVPIYHGNGDGRPVEMEKATASALIAELCLPVARVGHDPGGVVEKADILDFPGARAGRSGELGFNPAGLQDDETGRKNVVEMFKRGKLTYLFEGYCREREITALTLHCAHHARAPPQRQTRGSCFTPLGQSSGPRSEASRPGPPNKTNRSGNGRRAA